MANREAVQKWVDALRSGEYRQGIGALQPELGKYCCLGVACDISGVERWGEWEDEEGYHYGDDYLTLPRSVMLWLGIADSNPMVLVPGGTDVHPRRESLANLNDDGGWDFNRIADAIERHWLNEDNDD